MSLFAKTAFPLCASFANGTWDVWRRDTYAAEGTGVQHVAHSSSRGLKMLAPALAQTRDLRGLKLRVRFLNNYPYVYCTSITAKGGCRKLRRRPETKLLSVLAKQLNFRVELRHHPRRVWGSRDVNGTWRGLLESVVNDKADMAIGGTSVTWTRAGAVDFLREFSRVHSVFVTHRPPPLPVHHTVLAQFPLPLWLLLVLSLLFVAAVSAFWRSCYYDLALMEIFKILLGQDICRKVTTLSDRIFTGSWMLAAFVIACVYTSKLTSFLINGAPGHPVETLEQLAASSYQLAVSPSNKVFLEWLSERQGEEFEVLRSKLVMEPDINDTLRLGGPDYRRAHVFEDDFFQYVLAWMIKKQNGSLRREDIIVSRDTFMSTALAIPVQMNAPYRRHMDRVIIRLTEAGILQKWLKDKLYIKCRRASWITECLKDGEQCRREGEGIPITLRHLRAPFGLLWLGYLLAVAAFCGELVFEELRSGKWKSPLWWQKCAGCFQKSPPKNSQYHQHNLKRSEDSLEIQRLEGRETQSQKMKSQLSNLQKSEMRAVQSEISSKGTSSAEEKQNPNYSEFDDSSSESNM